MNSLTDAMPRLLPKRMLVTAGVMFMFFLLGLPFVTRVNYICYVAVVTYPSDDHYISIHSIIGIMVLARGSYIFCVMAITLKALSD